MKKIFNLLLLAISAIAMMAGCKEISVEEPKQNTLEVTPVEDMIFKASGNEAQILNIKTDADSWTFTAPEWVKAEKASRTLTVNVEDYTSTTEERSGKIEIKAGTAEPVSVNIIQSYADDLTVTPSELPEFKAKENADVTLTVNTNLSEWSYKVEQTGEWITVNRNEDKLTVKVADNDAREPREGKIIVTAGEKEVNIAVKQQAKGEVNLTVTPSELPQFKAKGNAETSLTIETDADSWSYEVPEWITASQEENVLKLNVSDNETTEPRDGVIKIMAENKEVSINVSQAPATTLSVSPESLTEFAFTSPQTQEVTVTTNAADWTFTKPEWITATKEGNVLKVSAQENTGSARSGEIIITAEDKEARVAVSQAEFIDVEKGKPIKNIYYCQVNSTNPLNALEYKLNNGSYFFDAVVIFSANIVYNSGQQKIELSFNDNVKTLMEQNQTYLQPLREAGIKVYMGLLGHHTHAGLCNLTETGAKQFAAVVANAVKNYNVDGVAMDDEWSEYEATNPNPELFEEPNLNGNDKYGRSLKAGARLCYEIKQAMSSEKEVLVYGVGQFDYTYQQGSKLSSSVAPYEPSKYMDVYIPDYGTMGLISTPFTGMTMSDICGYSYECTDKSQATTEQRISVSSMRSRIATGAGYFMWYGFEPNPESADITPNQKIIVPGFDRTCQAMDGNRRLLMPTHYYKKGGEGVFDTTRYEYTPDQLPVL